LVVMYMFFLSCKRMLWRYPGAVVTCRELRVVMK
jgi:hypothetical protein